MATPNKRSDEERRAAADRVGRQIDEHLSETEARDAQAPRQPEPPGAAAVPGNEAANAPKP